MTRRFVLSLACSLGFTASSGLAQDQVTFGTNWKAQAEHGGFYQAVATGIYQEHGLEVEIRPGGPQVNHKQLLAAGRIDFNMGGNMFGAFNFVQNQVPMVTVAAIFQKDPQILMAHPDQGYGTLSDLKGVPIVLAREHGLSFYEAVYVALAARAQLPLATLDRRMARAAVDAGVALVGPRGNEI